MNAVVSFLSIITADESDTSARRMLGICTEFERIARLVLDRKDREKHRRGKRRTEDSASREESTPPVGSSTNRSDSQAPASNGSHFGTPTGSMGPMRPVTARNGIDATPGPLGASTPGFMGDFGGSLSATPGASGSNGETRSPPSISSPGLLGDLNPLIMPGTPLLGNRGVNPENGTDSMADRALDSATPFQQPFVPQDLWQMPMALEWDWADMSQVLGGLGGSGVMCNPEDIGMGDVEDQPDDEGSGGHDT
jgi:hypothetical protein